MAEKEPEKDKPEEISPRRGAIELLQVGSVSLIPIGWLLRFNPWLTSTAWVLAIALFLWPFRLISAEVEEAEARNAQKVKSQAKQGKELAAVSYHSRHEESEVYHIFADCNVGKDIEPEYWTRGDNDRPLCKVCEGMTRGREAA